MDMIPVGVGYEKGIQFPWLYPTAFLQGLSKGFAGLTGIDENFAAPGFYV